MFSSTSFGGKPSKKQHRSALATIRVYKAPERTDLILLLSLPIHVPLHITNSQRFNTVSLMRSRLTCFTFMAQQFLWLSELLNPLAGPDDFDLRGDSLAFSARTTKPCLMTRLSKRLRTSLRSFNKRTVYLYIVAFNSSRPFKLAFSL